MQMQGAQPVPVPFPHLADLTTARFSWHQRQFLLFRGSLHPRGQLGGGIRRPERLRWTALSLLTGLCFEITSSVNIASYQPRVLAASPTTSPGSPLARELVSTRRRRPSCSGHLSWVVAPPKSLGVGISLCECPPRLCFLPLIAKPVF